MLSTAYHIALIYVVHSWCTLFHGIQGRFHLLHRGENCGIKRLDLNRKRDSSALSGGPFYMRRLHHGLFPRERDLLSFVLDSESAILFFKTAGFSRSVTLAGP
jgi:hypothetical protein